MIKYDLFGLVAPTTLIFYGLALVNGGKYTLSDIHYLGLCEIGLGIIALFNIGLGWNFGRLVWSFTYVYGTVMYFKYEK